MTRCQSLHMNRVVGVIKLALEISEMDTPYYSTQPFPQSPSPQANSSLTPPSLDLCSDDDDDDDSATSSSSISDNEFSETTLETITTGTAKRSIFKQYWAKNGGNDLYSIMTTCGARPPPPPMVIVQSSPGAVFEQSLGNHEIKSKHEPQPQQHQRRSIFQKNYSSQSMPRLNIMAATEEGIAAAETAALPRSKSTSALNKQPCQERVTLRSCLLRERRYSGTGTTPQQDSSSSSSSSMDDSDHSERSSSSSERSVNFSPEVKVLVYQKPLERYSAKGWSNYFA